jgi:type IX secretion system PorP/SprF family membrane protein
MICLGNLGLVAQRDLQFSHFTFNKFAYNPAYAGARGSLDALALYRQQWSGFEGAPTTMYLNAHTPFAGQRGALGLAVAADRIGQASTQAVTGAYAYHIPLKGGRTLSLGLSGSLEQYRFRWSASEALDTDDAVLLTGDDASLNPNFGAGAFLRGQRFYAGFSVPRLMKGGEYLDRSRQNRSSRTSYLMAGYMARLNSQLQLLPALLLSYNPAAPPDLDLNLTALFMDAFWLGSSFRLGDSVDAMAGMALSNGIRLGVCVDFTTSDLQKFTNGSWEVLMTYTFRCRNCEVSHIRFF